MLLAWSLSGIVIVCDGNARCRLKNTLFHIAFVHRLHELMCYGQRNGVSRWPLSVNLQRFVKVRHQFTLELSTWQESAVSMLLHPPGQLDKRL